MDWPWLLGGSPVCEAALTLTLTLTLALALALAVSLALPPSQVARARACGSTDAARLRAWMCQG